MSPWEISASGSLVLASGMPRDAEAGCSSRAVQLRKPSSPDVPAYTGLVSGFSLVHMKSLEDEAVSGLQRGYKTITDDLRKHYLFCVCLHVTRGGQGTNYRSQFSIFFHSVRSRQAGLVAN